MSALSKILKRWPVAGSKAGRPAGEPVPDEDQDEEPESDRPEVVNGEDIAKLADTDSANTSGAVMSPEQAPAPRNDIEPQVADFPYGAPNIGDVERRLEASLLPATAGWALPSVAVDAGRIADYWLAAASVAGRRHSAHGQTRQDSYAFALAEDGESLIVAVADGLGSRNLSHIGAQHVARALCACLGRQSLSGTKDGAQSAARIALSEAQDELLRVWAPAYGVEEARLLSTTVAAAWIPVDPARSPSIVFRVGDANAFTVTNSVDEPFGSIFGSDNGPINMVKASIPAVDLADAFEIALVDLERVSKIVLCTDGFADDVYESPGVRKWLAERWVTPCSERWMLDALNYARSGSQDDRTAAVLWLDPAGVRAGAADRETDNGHSSVDSDGE